MKNKNVFEEHPIILEAPEFNKEKKAKQFWDHIEKTKNIVLTWPDWKKAIHVGRKDKR